MAGMDREAAERRQLLMWLPVELHDPLKPAGRELRDVTDQLPEEYDTLLLSR